MTKMRSMAVLGVVTLLALMTVSTAASASPREIYADFADNGRLDQTYSASDLRKALADTTIQGYGKPTVKAGLRPAIQKRLGVVGQVERRNASIHGRRPCPADRRSRTPPALRARLQAPRSRALLACSARGPG